MLSVGLVTFPQNLVEHLCATHKLKIESGGMWSVCVQWERCYVGQTFKYFLARMWCQKQRTAKENKQGNQKEETVKRELPDFGVTLPGAVEPTSTQVTECNSSKSRLHVTK